MQCIMASTTESLDQVSSNPERLEAARALAWVKVTLCNKAERNRSNASSCSGTSNGSA